ncbi:MAG: S41 family peptidase [Acetatifactor sp.]
MNAVFAYFYLMDRITLLLALFIILYFIGMAVWHAIIKKKDGSVKMWRLFSFVPTALCVVHFLCSRFRGNIELSLNIYFPFYIGALAIAVWQFTANKKVLYRVSAVIVGVAAVMGLILGTFHMTISNTMVHLCNTSGESYTESFDRLIDDMKEHYVMNEWKEIDYDKIAAVIRPKVEASEQNNDPVAYCKAIYEYISMFHDGHIWVGPLDAEGSRISNQAFRELAGNDYGFSLFTIDTGETVAIMVEEGSEANNLGIHNGTVMIKWNGVEIQKAIDEADCILASSCPVKANEDIVKPIYFAGTGGEAIEVCFIDENGNEKSAAISSIGSYEKRLNQAIQRFFNQYEWDAEAFARMTAEEKNAAFEALKTANENFRSEMLTDNCGYLAITVEEYDTVGDVIAEVKGEYPDIRELVNGRLEDLKTQGMQKLVLDLRNNGGGYPIIMCEVVSLFTNEEIDMGCNALKIKGEYLTLEEYRVKADGRWADLPVVVLTNAACGSSGDGFVYALSKCPNVTTMGITCSEGIYQNVGGYIVLPDSDIYLHYPIISSLDPNKDCMIDTKADRLTRIPLDEYIPVTKEAAMMIFGDNDCDYEAEYAVRYLDTQ